VKSLKEMSCILVLRHFVPTWASALDLQLLLDALNLHMSVLTLNINHLSPLNHNSHLKKIRHVHAHHLGKVEE
jgi:hypothetical protein